VDVDIEAYEAEGYEDIEEDLMDSHWRDEYQKQLNN